MIKYRFSDKIPLSIGLGPYCDIIIRVKDQGVETTPPSYFSSSTGLTTKNNYNNDVTSNYNLIDLGTAFLLEYEIFKTKPHVISVFSKLNMGVTDSAKRNPGAWNINFWINYTLFMGLSIEL